MATDITKSGSTVKITVDNAKPLSFANQPTSYYFNAAGTILTFKVGNKSYNIPLVDLRIQGAGTAPASEAAALTAFTTSIFP